MGQGESKLKYQQAVLLLIDNANLPANDLSFWAQFWTLPKSVEEVFAAINPTDIREIKKKNPSNLATLLSKAVGQLSGWIQRMNNSTDSKSQPDFQAALNCIRLITRILPFLFEDQSDNFVENVFWMNFVPVVEPAKEGAPKKLSFKKSIDEEITVDGESTGLLATRLVDALLALLFMPNFTIARPGQSQLPEGKYTWAWAPGIGTNDVIPTPSKIMWQNRLETLKCLLACVSETLYVTPFRARLLRNKWLEHLIATEGYYTQALFFSLVNVACSYDPVGWGIPYNHVMFGDDHEAVATVALQIVNIILSYSTYTPPCSPSTPLSSSPQQAQLDIQHSPIQVQNQFVKYLRELKRTNDFSFLLGALERLVGNPMKANSTRLPYSMKVVACYQDMLMLLWRGFEENKRFLMHAIKTGSSPQIFNHVLYFMYSGRKDLTQLGVVQLSTFILLLLSGERDYCVSLNKALAPTQPRVGVLAEMPQLVGTATHADLLVLTVVRLLTDSHPSLGPIHECLLTILANISPFVKSLAMPTCQNLMRLFEFVSRPKILFAAENSHRLVHLLLEMFNNLVQYQYEGNARLVYAVLRAQNEFSKLAHIRIVSPPVSSPLALGSNRNVTIDAQPSAAVESTNNAQLPPLLEAESQRVAPVERGIILNVIQVEKDGISGLGGDGGVQVNEPPLENEPLPQRKEATASLPQGNEATASLPRGNEATVSQSKEVPNQHLTLAQDKQPQIQVTGENHIHAAETTSSPQSALSVAAQQVPDIQPPAPSFIPTNEWLDSWKRYLPLDNILRIITTLSPQIQSLCTGNTTDEVNILEFLQRSTLVGLLPVPHPILIRRYQPNEAVQTWLLSYLWGNVYLQHTNPPIFLGTQVKLFVINTTS
jgi:hypothetical protein